MSAESDLQALLAGNTVVTALMDGQIAQDRAEQSWSRPFTIYTRIDTEINRGLDSTIVSSKVTFDVQIWGDTRVAADAGADAVSAAIEAGDDGDVVGRTTAYDADLDLEATILTVEWWE